MKPLLIALIEFTTLKAIHLREEAREFDKFASACKAYIREVDEQDHSRKQQRKLADTPVVIPKTQEQREFLSIEDISKRVGIGRTKLYNEISEGRLKANKCGRHTRISLENFKKWVNGFSEY